MSHKGLLIRTLPGILKHRSVLTISYYEQQHGRNVSSVRTVGILLNVSDWWRH